MQKLIFVIDDEHVVARTLAVILQKAGYRAEFFYSAEAALIAAASRQPDLIVSDVLLEGMNGIEFVHEIDRRFPGTPFMLISGQICAAALVHEAAAR